MYVCLRICDMYAYGCVHAMSHVSRSEDKFGELVLPFYYGWVLRTKLGASGLDTTTHQIVSVVFSLWPQCLSGMAPETQCMYDTYVLGEWILL